MTSSSSPSNGVTLREVASAAGVSLGTASKALNGLSGVSVERARRVHETALQLGYRPNGIAADLRRSRSRSIGLVIPDLRNSFFVELVRLLDQFASQSGYFLVLAHADEDPRVEMDRVRFVLARKVAALVVIPCLGYQNALDELLQCNVPVVMADRVDASFPFHTVTADSFEASYAGTRHLLQLGHQRVVFVVNTIDFVNTRERANGYLRAMQDAGLAEQASLIVCGMKEEDAHARMIELLKSPQRPTAVFTGNIVLTLAALRAVDDLGMRLPDDLSLLGFDDAPWMSVVRPRISSISQPMEEIGRAVWELLQHTLKTRPGREAPLSHLRFKATLVARESTASPRTHGTPAHAGIATLKS